MISESAPIYLIILKNIKMYYKCLYHYIISLNFDTCTVDNNSNCYMIHINIKYLNTYIY